MDFSFIEKFLDTDAGIKTQRKNILTLSVISIILTAVYKTNTSKLSITKLPDTIQVIIEFIQLNGQTVTLGTLGLALTYLTFNYTITLFHEGLSKNITILNSKLTHCHDKKVEIAQKYNSVEDELKLLEKRNSAFVRVSDEDYDPYNDDNEVKELCNLEDMLTNKKSWVTKCHYSLSHIRNISLIAIPIIIPIYAIILLAPHSYHLIGRLHTTPKTNDSRLHSPTMQIHLKTPPASSKKFPYCTSCHYLPSWYEGTFNVYKSQLTNRDNDLTRIKFYDYKQIS